jgi:hypothetical protein
MTILTHDLTSWPIEDYHEARDRGKTWVALDGLLCMALQDTIDRTQGGNRRHPLLLEPLLDGCGTPPLAALHQCPAQREDALFHRLRGLARPVPRLGTQTLYPSRIIGLVAGFPFVEPTFGTVQVAADRFDFLPSQIPHDRLLSPLFLRVIHYRLLMRLLLHPLICDLFSMSWHDW